jgi:hypothetical protein
VSRVDLNGELDRLEGVRRGGDFSHRAGATMMSRSRVRTHWAGGRCARTRPLGGESGELDRRCDNQCVHSKQRHAEDEKAVGCACTVF